jgi:hypothetical protein
LKLFQTNEVMKEVNINKSNNELNKRDGDVEEENKLIRSDEQIKIIEENSKVINFLLINTLFKNF